MPDKSASICTRPPNVDTGFQARVFAAAAAEKIAHGVSRESTTFPSKIVQSCSRPADHIFTPTNQSPMNRK